MPAPAPPPLAAPPALPPSEQNLRFVLGLKLNQLRKSQKLSLKVLAGRAGLAISYLNEIEKGKKYPKPEKILGLAKALGVTSTTSFPSTSAKNSTRFPACSSPASSRKSPSTCSASRRPACSR